MADTSRFSPALLNALGLCVRGDVLSAYEYLVSQPENRQEEERFVQQLHGRFLVDEPQYQIESGDPIVQGVMTAYYRYFTDVLTKRLSPITAEHELLTGLNAYVRAESIEAAEDKIKLVFNARGYYFLGGKTQSFWGSYVWKTQESKTFNVSLPTSMERVHVYFMRDFLMKSWLDFATFGLSATGGWANDDGLYCVSERYKSLDKAEFEISFLKHEAQHLSDYRMFPHIGAKDLEYRAKLVELAYYPSLDKLSEFLAHAAPDKGNAHAYSAYCIATKLSRRLLDRYVNLDGDPWCGVSVSQVQDTALLLLNEHTRELMTGSGGI